MLKGHFVDEGYDKHGTKIKFIAFERYKFKHYETAGLRYVNNLVYKYKNENQKKLTHFFEIDYTDFEDKAYNLFLDGIEWDNNTIINHDYMFEMPLWSNIAFTNFLFSNNKMPSLNITDEKVMPSLMRLKISKNHQIVFKNMTAYNNRIDDGPLIHLVEDNESDDPTFNEDLTFKTHVRFLEQSSFINNTSKFKTACIYVGNVPWLNIEFKNSNLTQNFGYLTNDFYSDHFKSISFVESHWGQFYEDESNINYELRELNVAKFMYVNDSKNEYEVNVIDSTIDCQRKINERTVFTLNE